MPVAALLLMAAATPAGTAKTFVEAIYVRWERARRHGDDMYQPRRDETLFTSELAGLFAKDARIVRRTGEINAIDAVPLCSCQDDADMRAAVSVLRADPRRATVRVRLTFGGGSPVPMTLRLARTAAGWRIADVGVPDDPSILARLHHALDGERG